MATKEEQQLIEEARRVREETQRLREESGLARKARPTGSEHEEDERTVESPEEPRAKASSGDTDADVDRK